MKRFTVPSPARAARLGASLLIGLLSLFCAVPARSSGFAVGDVYLLSNSLPNGSLSRPGVMRVDALTGTATLLVDLSGSPGLQPTFSYDAYRDRLLYCNGAAVGGLKAMDPAGMSTALMSPSAPSPSRVAARGDGKIYLWYSSPEGFSVMDASGTVSNLLDITGTTRFGFGTGKLVEEMIYVPGTNSLMCFTGSVGANSPCSDGTQVCIQSIPLTAAGTQVAGTVSSSQFEVSTSSETVVGSAMGPSSSVFILVDTNSNAQEPRMLLVDPATLAVSVFASNGSYTGAAATNAGTYSHVINRAIVDDTFADSLRTFASGETGRGTAIVGGTSGGGTGEVARLIEIGSSGVTGVSRAAGGDAGVQLAPPSPNPFRNTTTLRWIQPSPARVTLAVFDISGRKVRTLVEAESFPAGEHAARWDGRTRMGWVAPAGLYHAVLTLDGKRETRPLVRLR